MTENKAIEILQEWIKRAKSRFDGSISVIHFVDVACTACNALYKRIPQQVKYNNRHGDGVDYWNKDYFNCPACGRRLRNKKPDPYCPRCGQALAWDKEV